MYKVITQKDPVTAVTNRSSISANSWLKSPQLFKYSSTLRRQSLNSNFNKPQIGYVSIDQLNPYSIVVGLVLITTTDVNVLNYVLASSVFV